MSYYAVAEDDTLDLTAWEYRDLYLSDGIIYERFSCPYCGIRLCAILIYTDGEISRSPNFSAKWNPHINDCDGEPIFSKIEEKKLPKRNYDLREMRFPEALIPRPLLRKRQQQQQNLSTTPSPIEIKERRIKAGILGRPTPSTYMLQSIVEVYNGVISEAYSKAKNENWEVKKRNDWINGALSEKPLRLEDTTNYRKAFCSMPYVYQYHRRIYNIKGFVTRGDCCFIITANKGAIINSEEFKFCIILNDILLNESSPKSHISLFSRLLSFSEKTFEVNVYAYGMPLNTANTYELRVDNLDHLYIKNLFVKKLT